MGVWIEGGGLYWMFYSMYIWHIVASQWPVCPGPSTVRCDVWAALVYVYLTYCSEPVSSLHRLERIISQAWRVSSISLCMFYILYVCLTYCSEQVSSLPRLKLIISQAWNVSSISLFMFYILQRASEQFAQAQAYNQSGLKCEQH